MISSMALKNFKCFEEQTIKLGSVTLLSGLNGMGKSTIIQSLLLLRQSYLQGTLESSGLSLNGELTSIGIAQDALYQHAKEEKINFDIKTDNGKKGSWCFGYDRDTDVLPKLKYSVDKKIYDLGLFTNNFQYLSAERLGPRTTFDTSNYKVEQHNQIGSRGEYAVHYLVTNEDKKVSNNLIKDPKKPSDLKNQVDAWLNTISPGIRLSLEEHLSMDLVRLSYQFVGKNEVSNEFRSTNVGFGITNVLPIIISILSATPGTIIFLENPEAHLHPKGQVEIGKLISRAGSEGVQVILETHSDHILNGIRLAVKEDIITPKEVNLHFFERESMDEFWNHEIKSPEIDKDGRLDFWPEGFFDQWDKSLDDLLKI